MIRSFRVCLIVSLLATCLAACSGPNAADSTTSPSTGGSSAPGADPGAPQSPAPTESPARPTPSERPDQRTLEIRTAEGYQAKPASLRQGEGFSLYAIDGFDFDSSSGRLSLSANPEYYVDIERLQEDADLAKLREQGENELKAFGAVSDHSGELVEHPLAFAELYLQASGEDGIRDYLVWKSEDDARYLFRLRNPKGEDAPAFAGAIFELLSTVE